MISGRSTGLSLPVLEVRERAAEILAGVGKVKLRRIALFRAAKWAEISAKVYPDDRDYAALAGMRAAEWSRIGSTLPLVTSAITHLSAVWSSTMSSTTEDNSTTQAHTDYADFATEVAEMVADQAPRLFAVVMEFGEQIEAEIAAWGMALDDHAYMTTVDGRNQYLLAEPENALMYVRGRTNVTPHLVWATPSTLEE